MSFIEYQTKQSIVSSGHKLIRVKRCVAQTAFESFTEENINPGFILHSWTTDQRRMVVHT